MGVTRKYVEACMSRQIGRLLNTQNDSARRADLARLRRGIGLHPGADPELWAAFLNELDEEMYSPDGKPTYAEWAVYIALTLFALHQQGSDTREKPMSRDEQKLGKAVADLIKGPDDEERVRRRFNTLATSDSIEELSHHLRGMVQLLKAGGIPVDYPRLAGDLYEFQFIDRRDAVKLRWGQDFYSAMKKNNDLNKESEEDNHE